ncbi:MAG: SUMF1/EgtB/PvdO family nonheme iron enzyme [Rubrivivax sp.]|nr:SUMF1/EgtB/PvdO family nonheme iron enzyme [Rubrivivax sp.]
MAREVPAGPAALAARGGTRAELARSLHDSRRDTLATFAACSRALPGLRVPQRAELNPPLWELGHIGWFQEYWVGRNAARAHGHRADPEAARAPARRTNADALYNSSRVPHATRWSLPLPDAAATQADLQAQLEQTLRCLEETPAGETLYFHRLALLHEDMHHEAALYMAQGLGVPIEDERWQARALPEPPPALDFAAGRWTLGTASPRGDAFAFDNEIGRLDMELPAGRIDAQVVRWAEYLPFVDDAGYTRRHLWSEEGWAWRASLERGAPRYLRRAGGAGAWQQWRHGRWQPLDLREAACHLSRHEAEAWCRWAGRRLPGEAEWERAALVRPDAFAWGEVWEWTGSPFAPYPGFEPHPYRDYSAPWFDGRPVLRGASFMTQPRMRHPRYRNFFAAHRDDVPAGFRSCALGEHDG